MDSENKGLSIEQQKKGDTLMVQLSGWLDPNTSPTLINEINLEGVKKLVFDMGKVEYVFSAGLRSFLIFQRLMANQNGSMKLTNVSEQIRQIFEYAGFESMLEKRV
ncbi:MAG TPA: anti-sigma factor antagonist [Alphaproteobacteria bacterium]|nr:anti-sigma factor antagonist [Alphaproteobacteria bacterium]